MHIVIHKLRQPLPLRGKELIQPGKHLVNAPDDSTLLGSDKASPAVVSRSYEDKPCLLLSHWISSLFVSVLKD